MPTVEVPRYHCMPDDRGAMATPPWSNQEFLMNEMHRNVSAHRSSYELSIPHAIFAAFPDYLIVYDATGWERWMACIRALRLMVCRVLGVFFCSFRSDGISSKECNVLSLNPVGML